MKRILVVSPEDPIREMIREALTDEGYDVLLAGTGEEAVDKYREERPDLVFVDTVLSGIDNAEVLRRFRRGYLTPPILVWIPYNPRCDESPWWSPDACFLKTASFVKVKEKIRELCAEGVA